MYKVYVDGYLLSSSKLDEFALIEPVVQIEANNAGSFRFTIPVDHPYTGTIENRKSIIDVYQDSELIFEGIPVEISEDMFGQRTIDCEGELTFLNDSVLRQHHYTGMTVAQLLNAYLTEHNSQTDSGKHFSVGSVTVDGGSMNRFTNYNTTMSEIGEDLINDLGGYLRIRHVGGVRYLDYLADSPNTNTQTVSIGKNLIDLKTNLSSLDVCSVLVPLGARLENQVVPGLDARLTIESVNGGLDYLENASAISSFGRITKVATWDDVTVASNLKAKGTEYLTNLQYENLVIDATAFDLGLASSVFEKFKLLDTVRVICAPNDIDRNFVITKMTLNLNAPERNTITLGKEVQKKLSAKTAQITDFTNGIDNKIASASSNAYQEAVAQATALITSAMGGYVYKTNNELYIMDTNDTQTARKVWRWNLNGLGYSSTGVNGPYTVAMTQTGSIVADLITSGTLDASLATIENINASKITSGILTGRAINNGNGTFFVDTNGNVTANSLSSTNATITGGKVSIHSAENSLVSVSRGDPITQGGQTKYQYESFMYGHGFEVIKRLDSVIANNELGFLGNYVPLAHQTYSGGVALVMYPGNAGETSSIEITAKGNIYSKYAPTQASDIRLKHDIKPINVANLNELRPVSFKMDGDESTHYGFIAQEVQETSFRDIVEGDKDGMLSIPYTEFTAYLVKGWQEHEKRIAELESKIKEDNKS